MIKDRDNFEFSTTEVAQTRVDLNEFPQENSCQNSNMNNGLSNGHALNLDYDPSGNLITQPNSSCNTTNSQLPNSNNLASACIDPLLSSSCSTTKTFENNSDENKMGLLNAHDQDSLPQNLLFLKASKLENGQKIVLKSDTGWTDLKSPMPNILPQYEENHSDRQHVDSVGNNQSCEGINQVNIDFQNVTTNTKHDEDKKILKCSSVSQNLKEVAVEHASYLVKNENSQDTLTLIERKNINFQQQRQQQQENQNSPNTWKDSSFKGEECMLEFTTSKLLDLSNQELFVSNSFTTDTVPESVECNDLSNEQKTLNRQCQNLIKRIHRVQLQQTHRNLANQMKHFVSRKQKLHSVGCQRFDFDFSNFLGVPTSTSPQSQLKSYLLQKDATFAKNTDKVGKSDQCASTCFSTFQFNNKSNCNFINNSLFDLYNQKSAPKNSNNLNFQQLSQGHDHSSDSCFNNFSLSFSPFANDSHVNLSSSFGQKRPSNQCNIYSKTLSQENKSKILTTIDTLRYNLRHLESKYDSDATDSSSNGESDDEPDGEIFGNSTYFVPELQSSLSPTYIAKKRVPIRNRASWKWHTERSAIASRWSWLQAQVSDLETKLRQQNDIFRHLRATKGSIIFETDIKNESPLRRQFPSNSSVNVTHINQNNTQLHHSSSSLSSLSQGNNNINTTMTTTNYPILSDDSTPPPENFSQSLPPESNKEYETVANDEASVCMRTIPFVGMKRRKLVHAEKTLSMAVKKSVKYSSIQCSCSIYPTHVPACVICNGRYSYMHSIDPEFMPYYERVSLLDSSCHPVICLSNDIPLGVHFTHLLKRENINSKPVVLRNNNKKKKISNLSPIITSPISFTDCNLKLKKLSSNSVSKSKKKPEKGKKRRLSSDSSSLSVKKIVRERLSSGCSSRAESPVPSPSPSDTSSNGTLSLTPLQTPTTPSAPLQRRRRSEQHAFDINNIVIPYSIAAATRVERLQYKEIITPKWRVNEEFAIPPPENVRLKILNQKGITDDQYEDITQDAFELRHSKCEENERQRIMSYYVGLTKNQNPRKGTARVRFESKSDSLENSIPQDGYNNCKVKSKMNSDGVFERKRHSSISKFSLSNLEEGAEEEIRPVITPFELRQFPLPDHLYQTMIEESNLAEEDEQERLRARRDCAKNSIDHTDSADDGTHASNSAISSPENTDLDINDDEVAKELFYGFASGEKDDPEWKPTKM